MATHAGTVVTRPPFVIGFTGSRQGFTDAAHASLYHALVEYRRYHARLAAHHGGCVGADRIFHELAREVWGEAAHVTIHPASNVHHRVRDLDDADEVRPASLARDRNEAIVRATIGGGVLLACPWAAEGADESLRSGTWQTVRLARRLVGGCVRIDPDGVVSSDRG